MYLFTYVSPVTSSVCLDDIWADNLWDALTKFRVRCERAHVLSVKRFA